MARDSPLNKVIYWLVFLCSCGRSKWGLVEHASPELLGWVRFPIGSYQGRNQLIFVGAELHNKTCSSILGRGQLPGCGPGSYRDL